MKKYTSLATKEGWLEAQNKAQDEQIAAIKRIRQAEKALRASKKAKDDQKPKTKSTKASDDAERTDADAKFDIKMLPKPSAARTIKMSPDLKKFKLSKTAIGATKVESKVKPTGVDGEHLLHKDPEPTDPFMAHLDQCDASFKDEKVADETRPLPKLQELQPNPLSTGRKDGGGELDYEPKIIFYDYETNGNICIVIISTLTSVISRDREGPGPRSLRLRALASSHVLLSVGQLLTKYQYFPP